jgi:superfamily II DNA or RNA helicase
MRIRFDRGTLVLEPETNDRDPREIRGARWDAEVCAWRVSADRYRELVVRFSDEGVRMTDEVRTIDLAAAWLVPPLRWYQEAALAKWRGAGCRGVVVLPTGAGKTIVAIAAMAKLGVGTLIVVPTRVLLDQWARTLAQYWPQPIGRLGDGDRRIEAITVATYASAVAWAPRLGDRFGLVVVDEAHHVGAWCPSEIFEMLVAPARLGLTATPPLSAALAQHVGEVVYSLGVADLVGDGLAPFDIVTVPIELGAVERARYRELRGRFAVRFAAFQRITGGASWHEFARESNRTTSGREVLAAWRASRALIAYPEGKRVALRALLAHHAGARTLVFTGDNATAYTIARELLVMPITCEIGRPERARMLERFRSGEAPVLVSSQVLDEGLDVPDADLAIVVGGTASARRHVQRIGRVLRPREGKRARVYELAVTQTKEVEYVEQRRSGLEGVSP